MCCFRAEKGGGVCGYPLLCDRFSFCLCSKKRSCRFKLQQGALCLGAKIMKPHHASSKKMGKPAGGKSAKNPFKSQNQQGLSSTKKKADEQGRKQGQKRQVPQTVRKEVKELKDYSPPGEDGSSKRVKVSSAAVGSWQPLSENSRLFLENVVESVLLSVLSQQRERKDDVQKHLNVLKQRVLKSFKTLKVPPGKLGNLKNILSLQTAEKQMLETNEESLVQLQEEITNAERSAERIEESIQQLQYKIQVLKNQLEEDEKDARKVFQENGSGTLHLPELPKCSLQAPILQEEILKVKNQKGLLKDMNAIQQSADLKNLLTLIEKTYEKLDLL
ncbi:centromere protein Q isoform X2 [Malurus melanocephalus]|uniref:centromere protein Q isoform X2 n=1 Tax=Malurus melanocephalus TaxID=175006 RepID=UPI002547FCCC|nr:centromere protein Q isoform X2 [Malurus melanocephalus]